MDNRSNEINVRLYTLELRQLQRSDFAKQNDETHIRSGIKLFKENLAALQDYTRKMGNAYLRSQMVDRVQQVASDFREEFGGVRDTVSRLNDVLASINADRESSIGSCPSLFDLGDVAGAEEVGIAEAAAAPLHPVVRPRGAALVQEDRSRRGSPRVRQLLQW